MKANKEQFTAIKGAIDIILTANPTAISDYETGNFPRNDRVQDLQKRFNWDLFWVAYQGGALDRKAIDGLSDTHINTVLNKVCPKITRRY